MQCPSLMEHKEKKTCRKMLEMGIDDDVSDFDVEHYCQGKPVNCYFFRIQDDEKAQPIGKPERKLTEKTAGSLKNPNRIYELVDTRQIET